MPMISITDDVARSNTPPLVSPASMSKRGLLSRAAAETAALRAGPLQSRRTKIIATIGPQTQVQSQLEKLLRAGVSVVRMNFSHGSHEFHAQTIRSARAAAKAVDLPMALMLDTKGPEIRTTLLEGDGSPVPIETGQKLILRCTTDRMFKGNSREIGIDYPNMVHVVKIGDVVRVEDGLFNFLVERIDVENSYVEVRVKNGGELGQNKGVNLPGCVVDLPAVTKKDKEDFKFGVEQGVDMVAASFIRKAEDVRAIREALGEKGKGIAIIAKIESQEGLHNFEEILGEADGIMVARGDLGVEIPIQHVCMAQKRMIRACNVAGKPVVTATQMLESMVKNPRPTRAEATDVANAVFDGTDCVMLSGETAKGKFPEEAVRTMARICRATELAIDDAAGYSKISSLTPRPLSRAESIASAAVKAQTEMDGVSLIVVLTESGASARYVAKYRPGVPILTVTPYETAYRQMLTSRAVWPMLCEAGMTDDAMIDLAINHALNREWLHTDDWVVIVSGTQGIQGSAHTLKIVRVQPPNSIVSKE